MLGACSDDCRSTFIGAAAKLSSVVFVVGSGALCSMFIDSLGELSSGVCIRGPGRSCSICGGSSRVLCRTSLIHEEMEGGAGDSESGESGILDAGAVRTFVTVVWVNPSCFSFLRMKCAPIINAMSR